MNARERMTKRGSGWCSGRSPLLIASMGAGLAGCGSDGAGQAERSASAASDRGRIAGFVWDDTNGNGQLNGGDRLLRDVPVYLDINDNGVRDPEERSTTTNALGIYHFDHLAAGDYNVRQDVPFGFRNTVGGEGVAVSPAVVPSAPTANIIGGAEATIEAYPFMAAVGPSLGGSFFQFCGGSLISDRWVVTAAHCTEGFPLGLASVLVGTNNISDGSGQILAVKALHLHPDYTVTPAEPTGEPFSVLAGFDIALWELAEPIALAKSNLNTVTMLRAGTHVDTTGTLATALGWGRSDLNSKLLQEVHVPISEQATCHDVYSDAINFETQICAGVPEGGIDACQGDSGGPLVVRNRREWQLSGITSYGNGCAQPGNPGVYARVSALSDWVDATAREPSRVHRVTLRSGRTELALFGNQTTLHPKVEQIAPRWQLTALAATLDADALNLSFGILDEAPEARDYDCAFDLDGPGPARPTPLTCTEGANQADIPGIASGIFVPELSASLRSQPGASFTRSASLTVGSPPATSAAGELTLNDATDPELGDLVFIDYYDVAALGGDKALAVRVRSTEFTPFVRLFDRDLREAGDPNSAIASFPEAVPDGAGFVSELVFFPQPGIRYVVGISNTFIEEIGSYTISAVNDGAPVSTSIDVPPAAFAVRRIKCGNPPRGPWPRSQAGIHAMGRKTFHDMAAYWPTSIGPFTPPMNEIPKIVFTHTGIAGGHRDHARPQGCSHAGHGARGRGSRGAARLGPIRASRPVSSVPRSRGSSRSRAGTSSRTAAQHSRRASCSSISSTSTVCSSIRSSSAAAYRCSRRRQRSSTSSSSSSCA